MSPPSVAICKSAERPVVLIVITTDKCSPQDSIFIHLIHYCIFLHQLRIPFKYATFLLNVCNLRCILKQLLTAFYKLYWRLFSLLSFMTKISGLIVITLHLSRC